jgi:4'-phosphopantetheinyl transferase
MLPRPGPGEVLVVLAERKTGAAVNDAGFSPDDVARADAMVHAGKRMAFLAGRSLARSALEAATGLPGLTFVLVPDANGRLELHGEPDRAVHFNISHGRMHDAVSVALGMRVGIDIEEFAPPDRDGVAETMMSPSEFMYFISLPAHERDRAFLRLWTRKEAVMKAAGVGFLVEPRGFCVGLADMPLIVPAGAGGLPGGPWFVFDLPGAVPGALATEGERLRVRFISP